MTQSSNPLRKYFRQPAIHLRLPSNGKFYPPGTIQMPPNGELPIYPMTAVDEIVTRTPDALFNGSSIVEIISSCVPNIKDAWSVPAVDLNALLTAVRLASYGHEMDISCKCPKCQEVDDFTVDLRAVLDNIRMPDYDQPITLGDLTVYFVPMTYKQINEVGRIQYEDQKIVQMVNNSELTEDEKMNRLGEAFKRITQLTVKSIAASINAIKSDDAMVTDPAQIEEFLLNIEKNMFETIKEHVVKLREATDLKPIDIRCSSCEHEYQQSFTLDMTNFFETAS